MLQNLWEWFTYGVQGDKTSMRVDHIIGLSFLAIMILLLIKNYQRLRENQKLNKIVRYTLGVTMIISISLLRVYEINYFGGNVWRSMPFHFCGVAFMLNILAIFTNNERIKTFAFYMGITGGIMGITFPGMYISILYYRAIEYYFSHSLLFVVPLYFWLVDGFKVGNMKLFKEYSLFLLLSSWFMIGWNALFGTDYYFLNGKIANGPTAVLEQILPWPGYYFILLPFAIMCGYLINSFSIFRELPEEEQTNKIRFIFK